MSDLKTISLSLLVVSVAKGENGIRNTRVESVLSETRDGLEFNFDRIGKGQGSGQTCVDSEQRKFDYGEDKLGDSDTAGYCAHYCVHMQNESTFGHLVGFNFHFEDSLCQCLYNYSMGLASDFEYFIENNNGEGLVGGTEQNSGWQCYAGVEVEVEGGQISPWKEESSNDENTKRVENELNVDLTVDYGLGGSNSIRASRSRNSKFTRNKKDMGGNTLGARNLCDNDSECLDPTYTHCVLGSSCLGKGFCSDTPDSCPVLETQ